MGLTESQTRALRIDGQLSHVGWTSVGIDFEEELEVGSIGDPDHGFSDYALADTDGTFLAIVEAKRSSRDALAGKEQARRYAEAIQARDGYTPFVFLANGSDIWFWDFTSNPRRVGGFFTRGDLQRRRFQLQNQVPLGTVAIDDSIVERVYQHEAIRRTHEAFEEGKRKALWVMATGSGKTRAATALIDTLMKSKWAQRVLFLVDRNELAKQALEAFKEFLPNEPSARISSATYDSAKRLYVATLQTMQDFYSEFSAGEFDLVISDECHRSIYNRWEVVLSYFDARLVGLTATPSDFIDRNTFEFFGCADNVPTFAYEYEQAVADKYLVPYEVYHAQTGFQIEGIHGVDLPPAVKQELVEQGIDPEDIDFKGTELERRVTNKPTTRLHVVEFFEHSLKEPNSNLPGKSILFALSHGHAVRLWEAFNEEYPQFVGLAEIIDSHMEDAEDTLTKFKTESLPRIAISVDMLDTGVDVPTVINLGFIKPVMSRIKFWQMIGRGTRKVDYEKAAKPWCPKDSKDVFRILDFGSNFERFQLDPEGVEPSSSTPASVKTFRLLVKAHRLADAATLTELKGQFQSELRAMIGALPVEAAGVREQRKLVEDVSRDAYWTKLTRDKYTVLSLQVAVLMKYLPNINLASASFSNKCLECLTALLSGDNQKTTAAAELIREDLVRLPINHPDLDEVRTVLSSHHDPGWVNDVTVETVAELRSMFQDLMRLKLPDPVHLITLNLEDAFQEQKWLVVGPEAKEFEVDEYREMVEQTIRQLASSHPAMLKLATESPLTDQDLAAIESTLDAPELFITEESLKQAYRAPHGSLVSLLRHALGIEELPRWEDAVRDAFEAFISKKAYLGADQLMFVRLFARRLVEVGRVTRSDLLEEPFLRLGASKKASMPEDDLDALLYLASQYEVS